MTDKPSKRRRWFQFRLRTLLIAILVLSLPLSWFAVRMERARRQREAVEAIEKMDGRVIYDWQWSSAGSKTRTPSILRSLLGQDFFDTVVWVHLGYVTYDDTVVEHLEVLNGLRVLLIEDSLISGHGWQHLPRLPGLRRLDLEGMNITDALLKDVKELGSLEELVIYSPQVTDAGLEHLTGVVNLRKLSLWVPRSTPAGLRHLKELDNLVELQIDGLNITDESLEHVLKCTKLTHLAFNNTSITDAGLERLAGLRNLEVLRIGFHNFDINPNRVDELQDALPNCYVGS